YELRQDCLHVGRAVALPMAMDGSGPHTETLANSRGVSSEASSTQATPLRCNAEISSGARCPPPNGRSFINADDGIDLSMSSHRAQSTRAPDPPDGGRLWRRLRYGLADDGPPRGTPPADNPCVAERAKSDPTRADCERHGRRRKPRGACGRKRFGGDRARRSFTTDLL